MRILLVLLFLPFTVCGQQMEWSNTRKLKGTTVFTKVLGENNEGIFLLRQKTFVFSKQLIFERYRTHLGFDLSKSITLKKDRLVSSSVNNNGVVLFTSKYNKFSSMNELSAVYLNADLEYKGEPKVVDLAPIIDFYDRGDFTIRYSVNQERILAFHTERTEQKKLIISMSILSRDLDSVSSKRIELPYNYHEIGIRDLQIDDTGNVFMLITRQKEVNRRSADREITNSLYCFYPKHDKMIDYQLNDSATYLVYPRISIDRTHGKINVTSFYSNTFFNTFIGVYNFSLTMGTEGSPEVYFTELSDELISALIGKVRMERGGEVSDFQILKTVPASDGGVIIISERASVSSDENVMIISGVAQTMTRNIYNYDDVLILAMNSGGMVSWHHLINKNQSSMNDGGYFGSIIIGVTPSNIHIIYNDKMRGNGDIMQYTIDGKGGISTKILIKSERNFISVIPSEASQIGANELLLPTMRDKRFALLKLVYDK